MHRIVRQKLLGVRKNVEYNEKGQPHGKAAKEMQSYIGVLARTKIPITIPTWKKVDAESKNKLWESVELAFVLGPESKKMELSSAACKWREFKFRLTSQFILPFKEIRELLSSPPQEYNFIELADWKAFVSSRLYEDWEVLHNEQSERWALCKYPHRMSRLGYAGLEDELLKTMDPKDIDRATLWKKAHEDKSRNIPNEKAKQLGDRIDELKKQVSDGMLKVDGSNDVLTMALEISEHGGRVRGVGGYVTPTVYFNQPRRRRGNVEEAVRVSVKKILDEERGEREKVVTDLNKFWAERFAALEAALKSNSQLNGPILSQVQRTP
ncbi:putative transposase, Ptta/En/Spm, plant [Rosa chinensis]|uniref:Putative transposase, Ptta/En/Spm, plant n=1 Tax=Rosa chinensis TaxID=74649 RepID=A0A2P6PQW5_ROSCH|nr:putative transposase, Ptta/En/Spm, plant [Rosa chinensis]